MRLLHIHMGYEGGAERFFVTLANALALRGVEQAALIRPRRSWRVELPDGMQVEEADYRRWWLTRFTAQAKVRRLMREFRPDGVLAWMPRAAELLPSTAPCRRVTRIGDYPNPKAYWKFRYTDSIVCITPDLEKWTIDNGWEGPIKVISNFTNKKAVPPVNPLLYGGREKVPLVVAMGRLVELKGFHILIRAMCGIPNAHLWILGEGPEAPRLRHLISELGLERRVFLLGWIPDPGPYLSAASVLCVPSLHETLGNAVLEQLAAQKPIVSSKAPGPAWILEDQKSALLVEPGDVPSLTNALNRVLSDPDLAARLALGGRRTLEERFSEEAVCRAYLDLFAN